MRTKKTEFLKKTKQFRATVSIDDLKEVRHWLFKELIIGPLKFKMAKIGHVKTVEPVKSNTINTITNHRGSSAHRWARGMSSFLTAYQHKKAI